MEAEIESFVEKLTKIKENPLKEKDDLKNVEGFIKSLYSNCDEKCARLFTVNLILQTYKVLFNIEDIKNESYKEIIYIILQIYQLYVLQKCIRNSKLLKKIIFAAVPDELWIQCLNIAYELDIKQCINSTQMDKLLQISKPENKRRGKIIEDAIKLMIDNEDKEEFYKGVTWIFAFNLEKLKMNEFKNIIYKSHIYQMPETLKLLLTTKRINEDYLLTLDGCYERLLKGIPALSELETAFIQTLSVEALSNLIESEAERLDVDINHSKFHFYYIKVTNELRYKFLYDERSVFEIYALNTLQSFKHYNLQHFINLLVEDPKYAYCWTKMLQLQSHEIPDFVKQLGEQHESEADEFIKSMKERLIMPMDSVETCTIYGKEYKLIMITTPKGLYDFLKTYFIDSKPKVLGIDSEAHNFKLSLFQLATKDWLCIIDIFLISKYLSDSDWTIVFQHIFDPTIERIGFAFQADYNFIQIAFPHLCTMLAEEDRKVLCLSTLSKAILEDSEAKNIIFSKLDGNNPLKMYKSNISLADVSKAVLDIKLCKDQQSSNWNWRPLTEEQKIYGVTDSLIVILIKEKIEADLKNAFGDEKAAEFLEKAMIYYKMPKKEPKVKHGPQLPITVKEVVTISDNSVVEDQEI